MSDIVKPEAIEPELPFWARHRFMLLIIGTIIISLAMTAFSLMLYDTSGSAQLDLSRPGYQSVSDQVERNDSITTYEANGRVNLETIDEFIELYDEQAEKAKAINAFNGDPLNPEVFMAAPAQQ